MTDKSFADKAPKIIYAADIGSSHITMMAGTVDAEGVHILGMEREICRGLAAKGLLENSTEAASRLVRLSKQLKNRIGQAEAPRIIFVSLGGRDLHKTEAEVDRDLEPTKHVSEKILNDMEKECKRKFENAYPTYSVAEVIWGTFTLDGKIQTTNPNDCKAKMIHGEYELYYGPRQMRQQWDECMSKQEQLKIGCYFVSTETLRTALLNGDDEQEGCAIISFGSDTTTYCAYYHGQLLDLLVVPFGSQNITKDIAYKAISIPDAEKLKKHRTSLIPIEQPLTIRVDSAVEPGNDVFFSTDTLTKIATTREDEILKPIIDRINENIDYLENKTLYITGGGARQKGLVKFLQDRIPMDVRFGSVVNKLSDDTDASQYGAPELSQLIGTIILGSEYIESVSKTLAEKPSTKKTGRRRLTDWFKDAANNLFEENQDLKEE